MVPELSTLNTSFVSLGSTVTSAVTIGDNAAASTAAAAVPRLLTGSDSLGSNSVEYDEAVRHAERTTGVESLIDTDSRFNGTEGQGPVDVSITGNSAVDSHAMRPAGPQVPELESEQNVVREEETLLHTFQMNSLEKRKAGGGGTGDLSPAVSGLIAALCIVVCFSVAGVFFYKVDRKTARQTICRDMQDHLKPLSSRLEGETDEAYIARIHRELCTADNYLQKLLEGKKIKSARLQLREVQAEGDTNIELQGPSASV